MKHLLVCFLVLTTFVSNAQTVIDKTITINPYLSFQNYEHFKRLTLSSPDLPIEYLDGFEFSWGYKYEVSIKETELGEWLSDGTQFEYSLNKILSKTKVPDSTEFTLFLDSSMYYYELDSSEQEMNITLKGINDSTYLYFDEVEIEVPEVLRKKFGLIVEGQINKLGNFVFIDDKRIRLIHL